jgi:hypothetical protein
VPSHALHASCRHLEPPFHYSRRRRRHIPLEGLPRAGRGRRKTMRLDPHEFFSRFLLHVLPKDFHRIRHYGLLASANRAESIATARAPLGVAPLQSMSKKQPDPAPDAPRLLPPARARLWLPHDCHRGVRARLRAKMPAGATQDRYLMSEIFSHVFDLPALVSCARPANALPRANQVDPCGHHLLIRSTPPPRRPLHSRRQPCTHTTSSSRLSIAPVIIAGAKLKSL